MIRYTLLRFLIFFGCLCVLWLLGLREPQHLPWLVVGSALLSMVISLIVLAPMREQVVTSLEAKRLQRIQDRESRTDTDEAVEDGLEDSGDTPSAAERPAAPPEVEEPETYR